MIPTDASSRSLTGINGWKPQTRRAHQSDWFIVRYVPITLVLHWLIASAPFEPHRAASMDFSGTLHCTQIKLFPSVHV